MKHRKPDPVEALYNELKQEDKRYGGRKIKKVESETHKKRPITNYKKAWEEHIQDLEEIDEFFGE